MTATTPALTDNQSFNYISFYTDLHSIYYYKLLEKLGKIQKHIDVM